MKKKTKIILITACALILCGVVVCACALAAVGFDISRLSTQLDDTKQWHEETVSCEGIKEIYLSADADSIRVYPSESQDITVRYYTAEYGGYELKNEDGELSLEYVRLKDKKWYEYIVFNFGNWDEGDLSVEIGIPAVYDGQVAIAVAAGSAELSGLEAEGMLSVTCTTGSVEIYDVSAASIEVSATAGDVELEKISSPGNVSVSCTTGSIMLDNVVSDGEVSAVGQAGNIELYIVQAKSITAECTTGEVNAYNISADETFLSATMGNLDVDMRGSAQEYTVSASTDLGQVEVEDAEIANGDKRISAVTSAGGIYIGFID